MYPMIWWWVASAVVTAVVAVIASDDDSSSSSSSSDNSESLRRENEKRQREAQEQQKFREEAITRERTAQELAYTKNSAVAFLRGHYRKHEKLSVFLNIINQQDSVYSVKQSFLEIIAKYHCDEITAMMKTIEKQTIWVIQLDTALTDLTNIKGSF